MQHNTHPNWHYHPFYAMGSHMTLWLELADCTMAEQTLQQAAAIFAAAERRLTRFSTTSELAHLNAHPGEWVIVSNILWQVVTRALQLADETDGLFDPTLLNVLEAAGYDRSFDALQSGAAGVPKSELYAHLEKPVQPSRCEAEWREVKVDAMRHALLLPPGVRLDLGGIGKGFTAQQVVNFLSQWGPCLVDAGGDLVAGDAPSGWPGWPVSIAAPSSEAVSEDVQEDLASLWLHSGTLATSGIDYRRWVSQDKPAHHLIDPRTGEPATTDLFTATILAGDACYAEAWATAALIVGSEAGTELLCKKQMAGALVDNNHHMIYTPAMQPYIAKLVDLGVNRYTD